MWGILTALLSGALMSVQGVFNTEVTKQTSIWVSAGWVQLTAFLTCVAAWLFSGRQSIPALLQVEPRYMLAGGVLAMALMLLIAFPCFRFGLKGPYFTLASIAVMEITRYLLTSMRDLTGGSLGMSLPYRKDSLLMFQFDGKEPYLLIILVFWLGAILLLWRMERTRYYLEAIREDDDAAAALGISVNRNLIKAALLSAFLVALGGTFYVQYYRYVDPATICGSTMALNLALITIIGGSGTILGPTIGAVLVIPVSELLRTSLGDKLSGLNLFVYGILLIVMIIYLPKGIISIPGIVKRKRMAKLAKQAGGGQNG